MVAAKTVLVMGEWEGIKFWKKKTFHNFDGGTEQRDGAITG